MEEEEEPEEDEVTEAGLAIRAVRELEGEVQTHGANRNRTSGIFLDEDEGSAAQAENADENAYERFGRLCHRFEQGKFFQSFIMGVILLASVLVGVNTYETDSNDEPLLRRDVVEVLELLDWGILSVFIFEIVLKVIAKGRRPWGFWMDKDMRGWCASLHTRRPLAAHTTTARRLP